MGRKRRLINNRKFARKNSGHPIVKANASTETIVAAPEPIIEASELQTISSAPAVEAPLIEKVAASPPPMVEKKPVISETPTFKTQPKTVSKTKTTVQPKKSRPARRKAAATKSIS